MIVSVSVYRIVSLIMKCHCVWITINSTSMCFILSHIWNQFLPVSFVMKSQFNARNYGIGTSAYGNFMVHVEILWLTPIKLAGFRLYSRLTDSFTVVWTHSLYNTVQKKTLMDSVDCKCVLISLVQTLTIR